MSKVSGPRILVAMDFDSQEDCLNLAHRLDPQLCRLKVGKELFTRSGPQIVERLQSLDFDVFLDLKFHDIPNTVAKAVAAAAELGVWMVNVHASGGRRMLEASADAVAAHRQPPLLIAVTVLTSMESSELAEVGVAGTAEEQVLRLARLSADCGLDGVVCSAQEASLLKQHCGTDFALVTPGIRPADAAAGDQRRVVTPAQAVAAGSDYLVVGRPITTAADPVAMCERISSECGF
jgi:orotidine-5'-phosphate decarboxylase